MPGTYLIAILLSLAGVVLLDLRFALAVRAHPCRTGAVTAIGAAFFLAWDLVGIASGVFVKGDSPLYLGIDLAPHLPLEELVFLIFLSYLAVVCWSAALRVFTRHDRPRRTVDGQAS
ncbi:lycopene cyclase domain-containing protein [Microbacterium xanthum]|uniref:lycopene cyclase domain-containing protein n=1 Tax=Microbacterium xanthum TaxID=3079794 RepID=UPI002AD455C4|nr:MULTISPECIES: lycopene cyclase domain-containing protein [unclassified Microbacterium]MDZ8172171.1 lycopene cyclase domain-containing protein [Microbacterium sp. KSW-48]MDZ8202122.1 lycopene cyclase domain-containing protein [Microbacterium sp. SSW1-59]